MKNELEISGGYMLRKIKRTISYLLQLFILFMGVLSGFALSRGDKSGLVVICILFLILFVKDKLSKKFSA